MKSCCRLFIVCLHYHKNLTCFVTLFNLIPDHLSLSNEQFKKMFCFELCVKAFLLSQYGSVLETASCFVVTTGTAERVE